MQAQKFGIIFQKIAKNYQISGGIMGCSETWHAPCHPAWWLQILEKNSVREGQKILILEGIPEGQSEKF